MFTDEIVDACVSQAQYRGKEGAASSTFGHNGVIIDGKGQLPCGHGWGCSGEIIGVRLEPSATFFSGDAARAYAAQDYNPVIRANRQCFLVKDEPHYAVILDDYVKDSQEHDFSLLLHTVLLEDPVIDAGAGLVNGILEFAGRRVRLTIQVLHPAITSIDFDISENSNNLPFPEHARWSFTRKAREAIFIAVIYVEELDKPSWFEHFQH